ncbi:unnamed protein product [Chrysoparadoxa australica]
MAFFGLTSLGPQNSFRAARKDASSLGIFTDEDFAAAFNASEGAMTPLLESLYHGPAPEGLAEALQLELGRDEDFTLKQLMVAARKLAAEETKPVFVSNEEYRDCIKRHCFSNLLNTLPNLQSRFLETGPRDNYNVPLTATQEIGWQPQPEGKIQIRGKKSCPETIFQASLVASGVIV